MSTNKTSTELIPGKFYTKNDFWVANVYKITKTSFIALHDFWGNKKETEKLLLCIRETKISLDNDANSKLEFWEFLYKDQIVYISSQTTWSLKRYEPNEQQKVNT